MRSCLISSPYQFPFQFPYIGIGVSGTGGVNSSVISSLQPEQGSVCSHWQIQEGGLKRMQMDIILKTKSRSSKKHLDFTLSCIAFCFEINLPHKFAYMLFIYRVHMYPAPLLASPWPRRQQPLAAVLGSFQRQPQMDSGNGRHPGDYSVSFVDS